MAAQKLNARQKMINMMYLVLTAMLALNVSNEVLDAFVMVEKGYSETLPTMEKSNADLFARFDAAKKDADSTKIRKIMQWQVKAEEVRKESKNLIDFIQELRRQIVIKADGQDSPALADGKINIDLIEAREDTDVGTRYLYGSEEKKGEGFVLKDKLNTYRDSIISIIGDNENSQSLVNLIRGTFNTEGKTVGVDELHRDWVYSMFYNSPVISTLAVLSKIQLDVLNAESQSVSYLLNQIDASSFKFTKLVAQATTTSEYYIKGSQGQAVIYLTAGDPAAQLEATVGGSKIGRADENGRIVYNFTASNVGSHSVAGQLSFMGPEGRQQLPFKFDYQVGEANAVVSPSKMNVFYIGVDNPIDVSVSGVPRDKVKYSCSGGTISQGGSGLVVKPSAGVKECTITLSAEVNGKMQTFAPAKFRVKKVPTPVARVQGIAGRVASKGELSSAQGLIAKMPEDFEFDLKYSIQSFTVSVNVGGYENEERSNGPYFSQPQKNLFNKARSGQRVFISDIKASGPTGVVDLPTLDIKIR